MNVHQLQRLSSASSFARGEVYYREGRVTKVSEHEGSVHGIVVGQHAYQVSLTPEDDEIEYSCDCPVGMDGEFCKHLVAAGLTWINDQPGERRRETDQAAIRAFLDAQGKETLVEMLLSEVSENRSLRQRLMLQAARANPRAVDLAAYRKAIARATRTNRFVHYHAAPAYARGIHEVIDSISGLLEDGHANAVIQLTEYMFSKLEKAIGEMDDSDGHMGIILADLHDLHHRACLEARPDPVALARRLFAWEIKSEWEIFHGSATRYAEVFGPEGLTEYRRLAELEWARTDSLGPGDKDDEESHRRFLITSIMEALALRTGDREMLVEIKKRNLSLPNHFLQIAEIYRDAGESDKALEWAERGLKSFETRDPGLIEFLAAEDHHRARHDDAMKLIWDRFAEAPGLKRYQELKTNALKVRPSSNWPAWREKAITCQRAAIERKKQNEKPPDWHWIERVDNSPLVEIFLWEKQYDEAWQEASAGGCSESLWLRIAAALEEKHPEDAVPIYQELVPATLKHPSNIAYKEAVKLIRKIHELMMRMNLRADLDDYLAALRLEYKRKRNFIKLLDEMVAGLQD
jgi:uncharacterized Zn finger protein